MIHLLTVTPSMSAAELRKLARRYAMTGGYELALPETLEESEVNQLIERYREDMKRYVSEPVKLRTCNAYRVLRMLYDHPQVSAEKKGELRLAVGLARGC